MENTSGNLDQSAPTQTPSALQTSVTISPPTKSYASFAALIIIILGIIIFVAAPGFSRKGGDDRSQLAPTGIPDFNQAYASGDINHDGKKDTADSNFIQLNLNCKKSAPCWNQVIGKTIDGENPIYTSDLDLNHNDVIDDQDLVVVNQ